MSDPSIEQRLAKLEARVQNLEQKVSPGASERDLDSQWGNPLVRKDPRDWKGPSMVGRHFSETDPDFLDMLARFFEWKADKDRQDNRLTSGNKPAYTYALKDAARARGWAQRLRNGWRPHGGTPRAPQPAPSHPSVAARAMFHDDAPPPADPAFEQGGDDEIPF